MLELLKEMVPRISQVAVMYGTGTAPGDGLYYLRSIQAEGYSKHVNVIGIRVKNPQPEPWHGRLVNVCGPDHRAPALA